MKKTAIILIILSFLTIVVYFRLANTPPVDPRGPAYAGSATCAKCHGSMYNSYLHTAHYIASLPTGDSNVHGRFTRDMNVFNISASQKIVMEKHGHAMFQTYYLNGKVKESHRFDIVLGGVKGESYLSWNGNGLDQLPISYYTKQAKWLMSPGYAPGVIDFGRIITSRCLECHASFIGDQPDDEQRLHAAEQFDKSSLIYSVDCERCHGPGTDHVNFQTKNPGVKTARFIKSYDSLSRIQKIDMCAVCHSGNKSQMILSIFSFKPGNSFAKFKLPDFYSPAIDTSHLDVHGNQVQLIESSKCFINSKMDCATCHDTHQNQRGDLIAFTQKCLGCHSVTNHNYCKMASTLTSTFLQSNCINCHMPALATRVILSPNMNKTFNADIFVRTHHIAIYPDQTKKVLAMVGK